MLSGLRYIPNFLSPAEQQLLLHHSLRVLAAPTFTSSHGRRLARTYTAAHPLPSHQLRTFLPEQHYEFLTHHSDRVIERYRECVLADWGQPGTTPPLSTLLERLYALMPPPPPASNAKPILTKSIPLSPPPDHIQLHLLHLAGQGFIKSHIDSLEASGSTIIGISLGSDRLIRFKNTLPSSFPSPSSSSSSEEKEVESNEFELLLEKGSVYIQTGPLRRTWTHEMPAKALWKGGSTGGEQRLSLILRDHFQGKVNPIE